MRSIKKSYSFSNKRDIWRLIPSESGYLVVEERDLNSKEVFFNCLKISDGKIIFKNFQMDEKYWIGIEAVHNSTIFFHKFRKPDMPNHKGIYAFDLLNQKIIWQSEEFVFQLADGDLVYAFQPTFEGRNYFALDIHNGEVVQNLESNYGKINNLRENLMNSDFQKSFLFPQQSSLNEKSLVINHLFAETNWKTELIGYLSSLEYKNYLLVSYHLRNKNGTLNNYFRIFDLKKQKLVFEETLNTNIYKMIPDSYFIKDDLLFLLLEKTKLVVYKIIP